MEKDVVQRRVAIVLQRFCDLTDWELGDIDGQGLVELKRGPSHKPREKTNSEGDDSQHNDFWSSIPVLLGVGLGVRLARLNVLHETAEYCRVPPKSAT